MLRPPYCGRHVEALLLPILMAGYSLILSESVYPGDHLPRLSQKGAVAVAEVSISEHASVGPTILHPKKLFQALFWVFSLDNSTPGVLVEEFCNSHHTFLSHTKHH